MLLALAQFSNASPCPFSESPVVRFQAARAACCAKQEELVAIKEQHKEIEKQLNTIRSVEEDLKNLLEESDRSLKENDKKAKHWDAQLAKNRRERAEAEGMAELPPVATEEELARVNEDAVAERITLLESELVRRRVARPGPDSASRPSPAALEPASRWGLGGALHAPRTRVTLRPRPVATALPSRKSTSSFLSPIPYPPCPCVPPQASMKPDMSAIAAWQKKEEEYCRRVEELRVVTEARPRPCPATASARRALCMTRRHLAAGSRHLLKACKDKPLSPCSSSPAFPTPTAALQGRDSIKKEHDELRKRRLEEFMAGFDVISLKLKEMYQMITLGGDAELELVDSLDPFSEGIVFSVRPPKKSWKHIANLSGGEKTLSSLVSALFPRPLQTHTFVGGLIRQHGSIPSGTDWSGSSHREAGLSVMCHALLKARADRELAPHTFFSRRATTGARLRTPPLQAHASVCDGRNRCGAWCVLHLGKMRDKKTGWRVVTRVAVAEHGPPDVANSQ